MRLNNELLNPLHQHLRLDTCNFILWVQDRAPRIGRSLLEEIQGVPRQCHPDELDHLGDSLCLQR